MSVVTPGKRPVSIMNWIMVMGLNQKRCRGRRGLSVGLMKVNVCKLTVKLAGLAAVVWAPPKVIVGAEVYPEPGLVMVTAVILPLETVTVPVAVVPLDGALKVTVAVAELYPAPEPTPGGVTLPTKPLM